MSTVFWLIPYQYLSIIIMMIESQGWQDPADLLSLATDPAKGPRKVVAQWWLGEIALKLVTLIFTCVNHVKWIYSQSLTTNRMLHSSKSYYDDPATHWVLEDLEDESPLKMGDFQGRKNYQRLPYLSLMNFLPCPSDVRQAYSDFENLRNSSYVCIYPRCSMYGIFTNICPKNHPTWSIWVRHTGTFLKMMSIHGPRPSEGILKLTLRSRNFFSSLALSDSLNAKDEKNWQLATTRNPPKERINKQCMTILMFFYIWIYELLSSVGIPPGMRSIP